MRKTNEKRGGAQKTHERFLRSLFPYGGENMRQKSEKHDAEEDAVIRTAIDLRRLIQLPRDTIDKVADLVYEKALDRKEIWDDQWFVGTNPA